MALHHPHSSAIVRSIRLAMAGMALTAALSAHATVVGGAVLAGANTGGSFVKLTTPLSNPLGPANSVGDDNYNSPNLFAFDESQNTTLASALTPDVGSGLAAGTTVASHYVFFDPASVGSPHMVGTVDFDSDILAILTSTGTLLATDYLAQTGVNYLNPSARGLESGDSVTIVGPRQIRFDTFASSPGDYVRVLTEFSPGAVPEPGSLALVGLALAALSGASRRRPA